MRKLRNDLTGRVFGRLTVEARAANKLEGTKPRVMWACRCECGKKHLTRGDALTKGSTTSCGCYSIERSTKHGMRNTIVYRKWVQMRDRCANPNNNRWGRYGGRGIAVCKRWDSFENFLEDMGLPPTAKHQPDRIDNDGDYEPDNVRWVTPKENANNRGNNVRLAHEGRTQTMAEWADELGIGRTTLQYRISQGWPVEQALKPETYFFERSAEKGDRYKGKGLKE